MKFLLDTDAISEPARRRPSRQFLAQLSAHADAIQISAVTVGEIVFGARRVPGGERYLEYLREAILPHVPVIPIDVQVAARYGDLRATMETLGTPLPDLDLLVAATALCHDLPLVTGNRRHFERVPGLELPEWFGKHEGPRRKKGRR